MKQLFMLIAFGACCLMNALSYAGVIVGGGSGALIKDELALADIAFDVKALPKDYVDVDSFRRVQARLSPADVESVPMALNGEEIQVRKLRSSIVDVKISKEVLPDSSR